LFFRQQLKQFWTPKIKAHLLPARTVGVQGDGRSYSSLVGLFGDADWDTLFAIAKQIPKKIHQVNRVVYVFSNTPEEVAPEEVPYTVTPTRLLPQEIEQLQIADNAVNEVLYKHNLIQRLSQVPVILFVMFGLLCITF
jgi:GMP synthase (glutamine-hydrolysing)